MRLPCEPRPGDFGARLSAVGGSTSLGDCASGARTISCGEAQVAKLTPGAELCGHAAKTGAGFCLQLLNRSDVTGPPAANAPLQGAKAFLGGAKLGEPGRDITSKPECGGTSIEVGCGDFPAEPSPKRIGNGKELRQELAILSGLGHIKVGELGRDGEAAPLKHRASELCR